MLGRGATGRERDRNEDLSVGLAAAWGRDLVRAQAPGAAPVVIQGRVASADEVAVPVRRAAITVTVAGGPASSTFSDRDGRFEIRIPPSTSYTLSLAKAGYVPLSQPLRSPASAGSLEVRLARGAVIGGTVIDAAGWPVVGAGVMARRADGSPAGQGYAYTTTDDRGKYRLSSLAAGRYELFSTRGMDSAGGTIEGVDPDMIGRLEILRRELLPRSAPMSDPAIVELASGQEVDRAITHGAAAVNLPYAQVGGAVTGVLRDGSGEPLEGARVQLWQRQFPGGRLVARPTGPARLSDDRGRYRIFHVPPGRYLVAASNGDATLPGTQPSRASYLPDFYPGRVAIGDAQFVRVGEREEVSGIDIAVSHTPGARVYGTALDAAGRPLQNGRVMLATSSRSAIMLPSRMGAIDGEGRFEFREVAPGDYVIRSVAGVPQSVEMRLERSGAEPTVIRGERIDVSHPLEIGVQPLDVGSSDVGPVLVRMAPTATLRGRIVLESQAPVSSSELAMITAAANPDFATSESTLLSPLHVEDDGTFEAENLYGTIRILLAPTSSGLWIRSVNTRSGGDPDEPIDVGMTGGVMNDVTVVVADTAVSISGRASDERSRPVEEYWAIVFSTDYTKWFTSSPRVRNAYAGADGRFTISALPPGDYWVAAVDALAGDSVNGEWQSPELLNRLIASARRVTLSEGERASVELRLVRNEL